MYSVHQPGATQECVFNFDAWNRISEHDREVLKMAGRLMVLDTWGRYAYKDIAALDEMQRGGNEFVLLDAEFRRAAIEAADTWADAQAAQNPWFKRVLDHRRRFQKDMENWPKFRFPIGQR